MLALGRAGDQIVFFGIQGAKEVKFTCSEDEARGALRQLQALLGEPVQTVQQAQQAPVLMGPQGPLRPPPAVSAATIAMMDAASESRARDAAALAAHQTTPQPRGLPVAKVSSEELARQEARRARIEAMKTDEVLDLQPE